MNSTIVSTPPFDVERARAVIAKAGHVLEIERVPDVGEDIVTYQAQVSKAGETPPVAVEWVHDRAGWGVYVDDSSFEGMLASAEAKGYSRLIDDAAYLVDKLNETDADRARKEEAEKKYLIPCTEVHCEFFGIGHEEFVGTAQEDVIHARPTKLDTNWGVVVNKPGGQTEWTVEVNSSPYEMPVSEIDELVAQLLLARADIIAINAKI